MPSTRVYSVDFAGGNLVPFVDLLNWGAMTPGGSSVGVLTTFVDDGLTLSAERSADTIGDVSNSLYVIPSQLPVESRFAMRLIFDKPSASGIFDDKNPWAVGLKVKKVSGADAHNDPTIAVTCQFRTANGQSGVGVRLNTPLALQTDNARTATNLATSDDYSVYQTNSAHKPPERFELEFLFCGVQAVDALGYVVGCGLLNIGGKSDQRVFSHAGLWNTLVPNVRVGGGPTIAALGVSVVTQTGQGTIRARLRAFAIDLWPLHVLKQPHG